MTTLMCAKEEGGGGRAVQEKYTQVWATMSGLRDATTTTFCSDMFAGALNSHKNEEHRWGGEREN